MPCWSPPGGRRGRWLCSRQPFCTRVPAPAAILPGVIDTAARREYVAAGCCSALSNMSRRPRTREGGGEDVATVMHRMRKFLNDPARVVADSLAGLGAAHPDLL